MYPYYKRAVCNSEDLLATFETVVRVADYMAVVEKMFDCSRDDMVDLAEALIVALMKILEKLRHEAIPKEKTWRVDLSDMVDFLVDPNSRDHLTVAQQQIRDMRDTIAVTLTSANPPSMTRRQ
uniref:Putative transcriptional protein swt1 n=1 Tax=Rhipicephalus microplus TaxID=6941 RepID=A0A6G5AHM1_RHIMP